MRLWKTAGGVGGEGIVVVGGKIRQRRLGNGGGRFLRTFFGWERQSDPAFFGALFPCRESPWGKLWEWPRPCRKTGKKGTFGAFSEFQWNAVLKHFLALFLLIAQPSLCSLS